MDHQKIRINRFWNFLRYLIIPFVLLFLLNYHVERTYLPPQTTFTFGEHCNYYGYPYEEYSVTTADGYILSIYRIPSTGKAQLGLPVLLIHGLSNSANCFIVNQCTTPPAFILADQNFDVWFGNCRGSHLSRGHTVYDATKDEEYWDWSFTELVLFDLPTFVNFVKNKTGHKKIGMLGHSQGAAAIMWMLAYYPDMKNDVSLGVLIGTPAGIIQSCSLYIQFLASSWLHSICDLTGTNVISDWTDDVFMTKFFQAFPAISTAIAKDLYDIDLNLGLPEHMGIYYHRIRGGTSLQNLKFWRQVAYDNRTEPRFYDHGPEKNFQRYGSVDPPSVDFKQIEVPLAVFNGKYDNAVPIKDSLIVKQSLKEETLVYYSHDSAHDHGGFIFSCNMSYFQDIISLLHKHLN